MLSLAIDDELALADLTILAGVEELLSITKGLGLQTDLVPIPSTTKNLMVSPTSGEHTKDVLTELGKKAFWLNSSFSHNVSRSSCKEKI